MDKGKFLSTTGCLFITYVQNVVLYIFIKMVYFLIRGVFMKRFILKLCSLFLMIAIILPIASPIVNAYENTSDIGYNDKFYETKNLSDYVSATEYIENRYPGLKSYIRNNLIDFNMHIDLSAYTIEYSYAVWDALTDMIYNEMPDMFHINSLGCSYSPDTMLITNLNIYYSDIYTKSEFLQVLSDCENATNTILYGIIGNSSLSDAEKALLVHDRLATHCEYALNEKYNSAYSYTMYGALVMRAAVCQGYTEAYTYLLSKLDIKSMTINSNQLNHAWNAVFINGKPYHVDVTWDDPVNDTLGRALHENFLLTDEEIFNSDHAAYDYYTGAVYNDFSDALWKKSDSAFQLVNDKLYYIDHQTQQLKCYTDNTVLTSVSDKWFANSSSWWSKNYSKLSSDGNDLFYTSAKTIYKYNLSTNSVEALYTPTISQPGENPADYAHFNIFGFDYRNGSLLYYIASTPNATSNKDIYGELVYSTPTSPQLQCVNGIWYYTNNIGLDFTETLIEYYGTWYYINNGIINWNYTGLIEYYGGWYYIENGVLNWNYTGISKHLNSYYYISDGCLDWNYTGLTYHSGEWYYIVNGCLDYNYTGLIEYYGCYYHIQNGHLDWNYSGLSYYYGDWYYITNGCLDWNYTGLTYYYDTWYYVTNGYLDWSVTTLTYYIDTWYYVENGVINWNSDTLVNYYGDWYYTVGGVVAWDYIGYVNYMGVNYFITYGYLDWSKQ